MTVLAVLIVTAGLAVLVAVLSHEAWPPVVIAVLGGLPALYLALKSVPDPPEKRVFSRPAGQWNPVELGVHKVIGGGRPTYVPRPHDEVLRAVLDPAVTASRLVVVRGGSSTGKSRAAWEAVAARLADWQLDYPRDPAALKERLDAGIPAGTVLWLGELRQYAEADGGEQVLGRLADLINGEGRLLITTVWPEQWSAYTSAAGTGTGPAATAGRLLEPLPELTGRDPARIDPARGGVIDVPPRFTAADLEAVARTGDPVLADAAAAAAAAGQDGQVAQYLAGVPDLLNRYEEDGEDPYGQAVIKAAMDAARLGHASPLPAVLLQDAAVGYLTDSQRTVDIATWQGPALDWAAAELNGAVRALQPIPPAAGTGVAGYRLADYLDQYGRRTRQDQLGPASLWDALTAHAASASDLTRLGQSARDRGLYRHAAALWTTAAAGGSVGAATMLIAHFSQVLPGDTARAARWAVGHAALDDPRSVAQLLKALQDAGAEEQVAVLLDRNPAERAVLDNSEAVARLLNALREADAGDQANVLARRAAAGIPLDNPFGVLSVLGALWQAGAGDQASILASRAAAGTLFDNPGGVMSLLRDLWQAGAGDQASILASRAAAHTPLDYPEVVDLLLRMLPTAGAGEQVAVLLARHPARCTRLDDPNAVAGLLNKLREADAGEEATVLADRAAAGIPLDQPDAVARLLQALPAAGAGDQVAVLLARHPALCTRLDDPGRVSQLLDALREAGADEEATVLARRAAAGATIDGSTASYGVRVLLDALRAADKGDQAAVLVNRVARIPLDDPFTVARVLSLLRSVGTQEQVAGLLARDPAAHTHLENLYFSTVLLNTLRGPGAGEQEQATALARRIAAEGNLDDPQAVSYLMKTLPEMGAGEQVAVLLARDPAAHVTLNSWLTVSRLLDSLWQAQAQEQVGVLVDRLPGAGMFELFCAQGDHQERFRFGREIDGRPAPPWSWDELITSRVQPETLPR